MQEHKLLVMACSIGPGEPPFLLPVSENTATTVVIQLYDFIRLFTMYKYITDVDVGVGDVNLLKACMGAAGQETSQQAAAADQPHHAKAASKKKQRGGKRSAAKGGKGARTTSGSMAHAADVSEEAVVEFFVPIDTGGADLEPRGGSTYLMPTLSMSLD